MKLKSKENKKETKEIKNKKWKNKQRVLLLSSRGVDYLTRHLMVNFKTLMPHTKSDSKFDNKNGMSEINEIAEIRNCNKVIYFEMHKKQDGYMWLSALPNGPSIKFHVENLHTMEELKLTGNCLKGSRPVLSFNEDFNKTDHWKLIKEMLTQIMGTPLYHPKSQPFIDHVYNFSIVDNRIWIRNYQIVEENGTLAEVGPRFVLNLIKIFDGSFGGSVIYENPHYVAPVIHRNLVKQKASVKYNNRIAQQLSLDSRRPMEDTFPIDETDQIFKV
jgi:ribosome biogenesis protein BRX1